MNLNLELFKYVSLHLHTVNSINDSILKIDDYINKAKELGLTSLSITNHGVLSDVYEFYIKCKKNNIKPIIGCEVYVADDRLNKTVRQAYHLVLIAKNEIGFKNLIAIHNDAQINGFYYQPRTDFSFLKTHGEGIIALSACVGGQLPQFILDCINNSGNDDFDSDEAESLLINFIDCYKSIFDDFYLELQPGSFDDQINVNNALIELAEATETKMIITNDVHYLDKDDYFAHNIHVCAGRRKEVEKDKLIYPDTCYYVMTSKEIRDSLNYLDEDIVNNALFNIQAVINSIEDYNIIPNKIYMPNFDVPDGYDEDTYLEHLCFESLNTMEPNLKDPSIYVDRVYSELHTIKVLGFSGYFLTVRDYVNYAKENNIPTGPGRGSVCGSLVAYLIGITKVDPIKYDLLFERFLSEHRPKAPDIDMDFGAKKRDMIFNYVVNKYGKEHCALVSTFSTRKAKAALKDTGRVFNIDKETCDYVAGLIPTVYYQDDADGNSEKLTDLSIEDSLKIVPELEQYKEMYPDWFKAAIKLSNIPKATSVHAAGTIISPMDLTKYVPLIKSKNEDIYATALDLNDAESTGLIKFDFLSLSTLCVIDDTCKMIGIKDIYSHIDENYDDPNVWNLISSKYSAGLFQISSRLYKQRMSRLKPHSIKELAACLALVRGPCIQSKADEKYMRIIEGKEEIELIHPIYDEITHDTNGILIYQEQLMKICFAMGFTLDEGYTIMKLAAKKKINELKEYEEKFMKLAKDKSMSEAIARRIFKMIVESGLYSFNESHAIAYAIITYITAYLKYYYPREFLTANLTNAFEKKDDVSEFIDDIRRYGYKFLPVDINESKWEFTLVASKFIRIGFCAVKSFGYKAYEELCLYRPIDSMDSLYNNVSKRNFGKKAFIPAILTGAFSKFYDNRYDAYLDYINISGSKEENEIKVAGCKFGICPSGLYSSFEEAYFGIQMFTDPVNNFPSIGVSDLPNYSTFDIIGICKKVKTIKDSNDNRMAFCDLSTGDGLLDAVVFSSCYSDYKTLIKKNKLAKFTIQKKNDSFIVKSVESVSGDAA